MSILATAMRWGASVAMLSGVTSLAKAHSTEPQTSAIDIVVTAQKRSQSINDVGLTVTAASSDTLTARGVAGTGDLAKIVSGFNASLSPYSTPVYTLRGIGLYDSSIGSSPSVAVYVDEVAPLSPDAGRRRPRCRAGRSP